MFGILETILGILAIVVLGGLVIGGCLLMDKLVRYGEKEGIVDLSGQGREKE